MKLKLLLPSRVLLEQDATRITAEGQSGSFTLLPRHIDYVEALVPGLLHVEATGGEDVWLAIDEGILVKTGDEVVVSTRNAVRGNDLGRLQALVTEQFAHLDEQEQQARSAMARMEADFIRRFLEL